MNRKRYANKINNGHFRRQPLTTMKNDCLEVRDPFGQPCCTLWTDLTANKLYDASRYHLINFPFYY